MVLNFRKQIEHIQTTDAKKYMGYLMYRPFPSRTRTHMHTHTHT